MRGTGPGKLAPLLIDRSTGTNVDDERDNNAKPDDLSKILSAEHLTYHTGP